MVDVIEVRYIKGYTLWLRFSDGTEGEIDLSHELDGPVFEPLKDLEYFRLVALNSDIGTIVWPNHADFAPEFLYAHALRHDRHFS